jgi:heptosyltransferase-2
MSARGPLIIRLCNWVGEAVLSLPTLTLLHEQGYELHLIGKRWATSLFEGHGWQVHVRPAKRQAAIAQLRSLKQTLSATHPGFASRPNYLLLTSSFSSALEGRLAGLKPIGYIKEGRGLLLAHGVPFIEGLHAADNYWRIGTHLTQHAEPRPSRLGLTPSAAQTERAASLLIDQHIRGDFVILCPFSGAADTTGKKHWPDFPSLARQLHLDGLDIVLCPGPGEEAQATADYPQAIVLRDVDLGTYAALALRARCTISNDTGPGHLAAAANAKLVSVLGPDAANMWLPQGEYVTLLRPPQGWPSLAQAAQAVHDMNAKVNP